jgi:hypothetical protein
MDILSDIFGTEATRNVADKTVMTSLFKSELLKLLPDNYNKEEFYEDLRNNRYIFQESFTFFSNSGDKFNYKGKTRVEFENYLKITKFKANNGSTINLDPATIIKIINYYDSNKSLLYWGGKNKDKNTKSKRKQRKSKRKIKTKKHY